MTQTTNTLELITVRCSGCGESKTRDEFSKSSTRKNGLQGICKDCQRVKRRKYSSEDSRLQRVYGISLDDLKRMEVEQDFKCKLCGGDNKDRKLYVDHCHETGDVRGLLCHYCNTALGMVKDNIETLKNMIKYLEKEDVA